LRNPWLHKLKPNGDFDWTAYNWTGPIVGVQPLRLVSESAVRDMRVGADGSILIKGWSDGGNSVFGRQPYDLRKRVPHSGFASSTWGARVLSVTHFVRIDGDTQEAYGHTNIMTYLALDDEPNSLNVDDFDSTASGHFVFTGGSASGLIETHDAWVKSWWVDYQTNPYAQARGGTYFAVYHGDMSKPRMTTVLPGVTEQQIEIKGDMVLLFGSAAKFATAYGINTPAIIKNATQAEFGGGHNDAYVMLINCKAKGTLTKVPAMTWAKADLATVPE
jgi:hypothetical protein